MSKYIFKCEKFKPEVSKEIKKGKKIYCSDYVSLDTETAYNHASEKADKIGWLSSWCFKYQDNIVCGRTPTELIAQFNKLIEVNQLDDSKHLIIYVHNLSYDITYLFKWLVKEYGNKFDCLCIDKRKYITFTINGLEFRCSYKLSNKSLNKWGKDLNVKHKKKVGTFDYDKIIYQDTPLTYQEWKYQIYDVLCLDECIKKQLEIYGHTIATVPLTSTGYIRNDIRKHFKADKKNVKNFKKRALTLEVYNAFNNEFAGGVTHGNRYYKNKTIIFLQDVKCVKSPIYKSFSIHHNTIYKFFYHYGKHRDFVSHYPSTLRNNRSFPSSAFSLVYTIKDKVTFTDIKKSIANKCSLIKVVIKDLKVKKGVTIPFAQLHKFYCGKIGDCKFISDNGRILEMQGKSEVCLTEYDYLILEQQYTFKALIVKVWQARKDYIPNYLADSIDKYFLGKSDFKDKVHSLKEQGYNDYNEELFNANTDLMKSKNGLNGIYGSLATAIVRLSYKPDIYGNWADSTESTPKEQIEKYYNNWNSFNEYQLGCYCTSLARYELYQFILIIGYSNVLYCDTDSIFYHSTPSIEKRIAKLNETKRAKAIKHKAFIINENGKNVYYDWFDDEKENIRQFRFLHSKCYAYVENKKTHCTIAGVQSFSRYYTEDNITRIDELKADSNNTNLISGINQLKNGKMFIKCGGTSCTYINSNCTTDYINNHLIEYSDSAIIGNVVKTLKDNETILDIDYLLEWSVADYVQDYL